MRSVVLVIAPHMDDEVLGCAGVIARHISEGDRVAVCVVANRAYNHRYDLELIEKEKRNTLAAKKILGYQEIFFLGLNDEQLDDKEIDIVVPLEDILRKVNPNYVYIPHKGDSNQDHRAVFNAAIISCRFFANKNIRKLLSFEVPSATDQSAPLSEAAFLPNYYVNIDEFIDKKISALRCFKAECKEFPHPRSPEAVTALARKRGSEVGFKAAEAFMILREKW